MSSGAVSRSGMVPWREAWREALYGERGFFLRDRPADHFSTSVNANPLFAEAVLTLIRREGLTGVLDMGAGGGELLTALHHLDPTLLLHGVDLAGRPPHLDPSIVWSSTLPRHFAGLLVAHEWLDNVPCDVVELDADGAVRLVLVNPTTGEEALGDRIESAWLETWWPLAEPGRRAEIGEPRDLAWADAVRRVDGIALAIDYAHTRESRPPLGSLSSYADGRQVDVLPDGARDVTAHVAVDSLAAAVSATVTTQRESLDDLGVTAGRPALDLARSDPLDYVRELARASQAGELRAQPGWGDFAWAMADTRVVEG